MTPCAMLPITASEERLLATAKDPLAAVKKRSLSIGRLDHNGGAKASLYLDAKGVALLKSLMSKAKPGAFA